MKIRAKHIAELVTILAEAFRKDVTAVMLRAYEIGLNDLPIETIDAATQKAIRQSPYMPTVQELRSLCGDVPIRDRAVIAWGVLLKTIGSLGHRRSISFDDPFINAAVRNIGGWSKLCEATSDDLNAFVRPRFEKAYCTLATHGCSAEMAGRLIGLDESENAARGFTKHIPATVPVGTGLPAPANAPRITVEKKPQRRIDVSKVLKTAE